MKTRKFVIGVCVILLVLSSAVIVSAAGAIPGDCLDSVTMDGNTICFMGQDNNGDGTTTWTYGARKDFTVASLNAVQGNALSHITFSLCVDDPGSVDPSNGDAYTTPAGYNGFVGRAGIVYTVIIGVDPTTGVGGIKYEDGSSEQSAGDVDIFQFTQPTQKNTGTELTDVGFKNGNGAYVVQILGPICDPNNAVEFTSFKAQSASLISMLLQWLGLR